jgi:hypothetical protein
MAKKPPVTVYGVLGDAVQVHVSPFSARMAVISSLA